MFGAELADAGRNLVVEIVGEHQPTTGEGHASVEMRPFVFCSDGPKLDTALPMLRGIVSDAQGWIEARGRLGWDDAAVRGQLDVALRDVSASVAAVEFEHLFAAVSVHELLPLNSQSNSAPLLTPTRVQPPSRVLMSQ